MVVFVDEAQPGLWSMAPPDDRDTPMVAACKATLDTLRAADRLPPERAALAQLCLSLSAAIDGGARSGRASAVAMAAAQLRDTMLVLDPPPDDSDATTESLRLMRDFMERLDAAAEAGTTTLRAVQ